VHQKVTFSLDIGARTANHGDMGATYPSGGGADPFAVPGVYLRHESEPVVAPITLEVDGELFALMSTAVPTTRG